MRMSAMRCNGTLAGHLIYRLGEGHGAASHLVSGPAQGKEWVAFGTRRVADSCRS